MFIVFKCIKLITGSNVAIDIKTALPDNSVTGSHLRKLLGLAFYPFDKIMSTASINSYHENNWKILQSHCSLVKMG